MRVPSGRWHARNSCPWSRSPPSHPASWSGSEALISCPNSSPCFDFLVRSISEIEGKPRSHRRCSCTPDNHSHHAGLRVRDMEPALNEADRVDPVDRDRCGRLRASPVMQTMTICRSDHFMTSGSLWPGRLRRISVLMGMVSPLCLGRAERSSPNARRGSAALCGATGLTANARAKR